MNVFRDNLFAGKVALVTGGATGIGRGIAQALAQHGASVAIASRNEENLDSAPRSRSRESTGRRCLPIVADVRQSEAVGSAAVNRVVAELGSLDLLINNAAGNFFCPSAKLSPNGFRHGDRHRRQGDVECLAGSVRRVAGRAWRPDPEHQRHTCTTAARRGRRTSRPPRQPWTR